MYQLLVETNVYVKTSPKLVIKFYDDKLFYSDYS